MVGRAPQATLGNVLDAGVHRIPCHDSGTGRAQRVRQRAAANLVGGLEHGDEAWQPAAQHLYAAFRAPLHLDAARRSVEGRNLCHIGQLVQAETLGDAGPDLCGIAVDCLLAGEYQVRAPIGGSDLADGGGERVGRRQRVGAGEGAIREQDRTVEAERQSLAQAVLGRRRPHGEDGDLAAESVAQPQGLLEREQIVGVDDRRHPLAHNRVGHGMDTDLRRIRNLLDADDDVHAGAPSRPHGSAITTARAVPSAIRMKCPRQYNGLKEHDSRSPGACRPDNSDTCRERNSLATYCEVTRVATMGEGAITGPIARQGVWKARSPQSTADPERPPVNQRTGGLI